MKIPLLTLFIILGISCYARKVVIVHFKDNPPEIAPTIDEALFYKDVKTISIKSRSEHSVYSSKDLSSQLNVLIATIQKEFLKGGFEIKENNADITIEIISIELKDLSTNTVTLDNGKTKTYECNFTNISGVPFTSAKVFVKVLRNDKIAHYTYYMTPCTNGCIALLDNGCRLTRNKSTKLGSYSDSSDDLLPVERMGLIIAKYIQQRTN